MRPRPSTIRWATLLVAVASIGLVAPPSVAGPTRTSTATGRHGIALEGASGTTRTTAQLLEAAVHHAAQQSGEPHPPLPVGRGPAKQPNPDALPSGPAMLTARRPSVALTTASSFDGPSLEGNIFPPDTQGDVGPTQFVVTLNSRFRSYSKAGAPDGALDILPDDFFATEMTPVGSGGCNFTSDPHIRYDRLSHRWFVVMIDVPGCSGAQSNRIMIAVSDSDTLTTGTTWTYFHIDVPPSQFADYPTLGIDNQALYIGTNDFAAVVNGSFTRTDGYVVQKASILGTGPIHSTLFAGLAVGTGAGPFTPQGVDDPYDADPAGYFIGSDNAQFGKLDLVRVANPGSGTPTITTVPITVPATALPVTVPHLGNTGGSNGQLDGMDDRLLAATMTADGHLWTAHGIGVNASGVATVSSPRDAARWYEIGTLSGTPSLVQRGTVFDGAASNPAFYWMPTLAVSGQGIMAIGGSQAGAAQYADAWYASRLPGDVPGTTSAPTAYTASSSAYNPTGDTGGTGGRRWGDYSLTRVDPADNQTLWTIQEYTSSTDTWGVRVARLRAPAPATPASTSTPVPAGTSAAHLTLTGTSTGGSGWYDPGAGFPQRLQVSAGCGVTVSSVSFDSPTSLGLVLDTTGAVPGTCAVTTTNPDGQSTTAAVLDVTPAPVPPTPPVPPVASTFQPDGWVKLALKPTSLGDNVYDADGTGQAVLAKRRHRAHAAFTVTLQNDGNTADALRLLGTGQRRGFRVSYLFGTTDVTAAVLGGTFVTPTLAPGATAQLRVVVRVKPRTRIRSVGSWLVTAVSTQSADRLDAVLAKVRVIR